MSALPLFDKRREAGVDARPRKEKAES